MIDGVNLQAVVIVGAVFLGVVKLIVIVAQMHSSIKVLEDKIKALFGIFLPLILLGVLIIG